MPLVCNPQAKGLCIVCGRPAPPGWTPRRPRKLCGRPLCAKAANSGRRKTIEGIPSAPLVRPIIREAALARGCLHGKYDGDYDKSLSAILDRLGMSERLFAAWKSGERLEVSFDRADQILIDLGLLWFDVWNPETVRLPILEVRHYRRAHRKGRAIRALTRTDRIGDLGPDYTALALVEALFEGDAPERLAVEVVAA